MDQGWDPEGSGIVSTLGRLGRRLNGTEILPFAARDSVPRLLRPAPAPRLGGRRGRVCRPVRFSLQTVEHGFPHQPSALGYSPCLRILAIGTRSGAVKLYGAPGVEFMGLHQENNAVVQIYFLPGQVRGLPTPFLRLPEEAYGEAGVWGPWVWC